MAELFVAPFNEVITKNYDLINFVPKDINDEGYTEGEFKDPDLGDLCHAVLMICNLYIDNPKYFMIMNNTLFSADSSKRLVQMKVFIPDITDTYNIIKIRRMFMDYLDLYNHLVSTRGGKANPIDIIIKKYGFFLNRADDFNQYIATRRYKYAKSTIARGINFLLYSVLFNIAVGLKNGTQQFADTEYPITTIYKISDRKSKFFISLEIENSKKTGVFTISSEIEKK